MRQRLVRIALVVFVIATFSFGVVAVAKRPPGPGPGSCPSPHRDCICYMLYAPVVCGANNCSYSNDCFASCAGWNPAADCTSLGGPIEVE